MILEENCHRKFYNKFSYKYKNSKIINILIKNSFKKALRL